MIWVRCIGITPVVFTTTIDLPARDVTKAKGPASRRGPCFVEGVHPPFNGERAYLLPVFLPALSPVP